MKLEIDARDEGKALLDFMKNTLGLSGAFIRHLKFSENGITVNGEHKTVRYILKAGDILSLKTEDDNTAAGENLPVPVDLPLEIIYEDSDIVIPNKPPFMPTHPSHGHYDDTLANALAYRYRSDTSPFVFRPVNRLDRNTSGAVIVARNRIAASHLSLAMKNGQIHKKYLAVLDGIPPEREGKIETYMRRTAQSIIVREVCEKCEGADYTLTEYSVIAAANGKALVLASPKTGRTHQLRVHFASLGCPITGDTLYGSASPFIERHALHSFKTDFPHPSDNRIISVRAPLYTDILQLINRFFGNSIQISEQETGK